MNISFYFIKNIFVCIYIYIYISIFRQQQHDDAFSIQCVRLSVCVCQFERTHRSKIHPASLRPQRMDVNKLQTPSRWQRHCSSHERSPLPPAPLPLRQPINSLPAAAPRKKKTHWTAVILFFILLTIYCQPLFD